MNKRVKSEISCCNFFKKNHRGQIWVETVIYTLIAFALIGLVLAFAKPKIEEIRDKAIIEQSITVMQDIDSLITDIRTTGSKRTIDVNIRKGNLRIDGISNKLIFEFEGKYTYNEPGEELQEGALTINTEVIGKTSFVNITRDYSDYNITFNGEDSSKVISKASTPYNFIISNLGKDSGDKTIINIQL